MRVINLDWLEVYCIEPEGEPLSSEFFRKRGLEVESRSYGTRQYAEMFTIKQNGHPLIEVRRDPLSVKGQGGILPKGACHLRLPNEMLYTRQPVHALWAFIKCYGYEFKNITRFDICMDFPQFDSGMQVQDFIDQYMKGEIAKIHQSKLAMHGQEKNVADKTATGWDVNAHGTDEWEARSWNSLKWGAPTSAISTKLYNKTIELDRPGHDKPYIRQHWDAVYKDYTQMWRIEFSIKAAKRHMVQKDSGQYIEIKLEHLADRKWLQYLFFSFFSEYFDFRIVQTTREGTRKRKDLCAQLDLFSVNKDFVPFSPLTITNKKDADRTTKLLVKRLKDIVANCDCGHVNLAKACLEVLMFLNWERNRIDVTPEYIEEQWEWIKQLENKAELPLTFDH